MKQLKNETWIFLTDFLKILKYQISWKSIQWEQSCQRGGQTDTVKLIITFGNFANMPKKHAMFVIICLVNFYEIWYRSFLQKVVKCDFLEALSQLCWTAQMDCCLHFPHFMTDLYEFSVGYLHVMMLSSCVCCENRSSEDHTLLMSLLWIKLCARDIHKSILSDWVLCRPMLWKPCFEGVNGFVFVLAAFIVWCGGNLISEHFSVERLWVSWKLAQGKPCCSCGHQWSYIYVCTLKPYDIFKAKNAFGKPVLWWCVHHLHHV
jgi:hypothetical protein